jgi:uncharacterized protein YecE (DUF72 family)
MGEIPASLADSFPGDGPHLERYARVMNAAEINSSFHRPHRRSTYERWSSLVPDDFAFSVKIPKTISHQKRCAGCADELEQFINETAGLGQKRHLLLLQLPPSFQFEEERFEQFFDLCRRLAAPLIVCEPRHASWFTPEADALLEAWQVARAPPTRRAFPERRAYTTRRIPMRESTTPPREPPPATRLDSVRVSLCVERFRIASSRRTGQHGAGKHARQVTAAFTLMMS